MATVVNLGTEVIHRYVYELRFDFGQVFWDRAGRIAKDILSRQDEWDFEGIDINNCRLARRDMNMTFNFGHSKLDFSQTQSAEVDSLLEVGEFGAKAEELTSAVTANLELESFPRIGFRVWHLYPSANREHSHEMIRDLKLFRLDSQLASTLGDVSDVSHRLVAERPKHMVRVAVGPFEQQIELPPSVIRAAKTKAYKQATEDRSERRPGIDRRRQLLIDQKKAEKMISHYPQFGVLLDLDAYIEDPPYSDDLSVSDFIATAFEDFDSVKRTVLTTADSS